MIVSMMKYSFIVLESQHENFLNRLGDLGVIHVTINPYSPSDEEQLLISRTKELQVLHNKLLFSKNEYKNILTNAVAFEGTVNEFEQKYSLLSEKFEQVKAIKLTVKESLEQTIPWGDFSIESIERLEEHGLYLRYFLTSEKNFNKIDLSQYPVEEINQDGGNVYFVMVGRNLEEDVIGLKNCREVSAPKTSIKKLSEQLVALELEYSTIRENIASLIAGEQLIQDEIELNKCLLEYKQIKNSNIRVAEDSLVMLEGWAPADKCNDLDLVFDAMETTLVFKNKPTIDEEPPVLLKNNRFARSAEVITKLYSLPKYNEVDMTPFYIPFFILFVGMCLGDCGYGLLLLLGGIAARFIAKDKSAQGVIDLVVFCGISTIFVGFITGVFFGVELPKTELFAPVKDIFIPTSDMFGIALVIGMIQIIYAIILRSIIRMRRYGILYGFAGLGWVFVILSTLGAIYLPDYGVKGFTTDSIAYYIIMGISFVMMFFFQDPKKNIFANFGMGLWELYNNVTGLLGDVLSYIRLFALGLSGGVIAGVFNALAISMSGDIPGFNILIMVLIMVVGHSINFFMSAIGSLVHPLRLTFVEFYKNSGFEGGGTEYNPFKKK